MLTIENIKRIEGCSLLYTRGRQMWFVKAIEAKLYYHIIMDIENSKTVILTIDRRMDGYAGGYHISIEDQHTFKKEKGIIKFDQLRFITTLSEQILILIQRLCYD